MRAFKRDHRRLQAALAFLLVGGQEGGFGGGGRFDGAPDVRLRREQKLTGAVIQGGVLGEFGLELTEQRAQMFLIHEGKVPASGTKLQAEKGWSSRSGGWLGRCMAERCFG